MLSSPLSHGLTRLELQSHTLNPDFTETIWSNIKAVDFSITQLTNHLRTFNPNWTHILGAHFSSPNSLSGLVRTLSLISKGGLFKLFPIFMDFELDGDVNGEVLGNSVDVEGRAYSEDGMGGCSVDVTNDLSGREMVAVEEVQPVNSSTPVDEPYISQEFESEAEAHAFYNAYATRVGFIIRVSKLSRSRRDGSTIGRALVCNREGFRMPDKREKIVRQRSETRVGCKAMILVRKESSGKWVVTKLVKDHTHPLSPGKGRRDLIYDQYPNEHDKVRELSQQLAVEKKRTATYKRQLEMIFEHIEDHNQSLAKKIQGIVDSVKEMESKEQESRR